ncbi:MAG: D-amino acid dehydrogenase [Alphaproteobacteria bacterium]|nr:D-amino acid dehydrogenase [Alphaproteobacteria bacterium]
MARESKSDVLVLGAGVVGVATAYWLARAGKAVTVIDRLPGPGLDTSFANGGQVAVSHAEPWAGPRAPLKVLSWLMKGDSPLLFRPRLDPRQWWWLAQWLIECWPARNRRNTVEMLRLALHSQARLAEIRAREGLEYHGTRRGILNFYRDRSEFEAACAVNQVLEQNGIGREILDEAGVVEREPALADISGGLAGGLVTLGDESGDAHVFTRALAERATALGVEFRYGQEVVGLESDAGARRVTSVRVKDLASGRYSAATAGDYVVALAAYSPALLQPLGIWLNLYPAKGYSLTVQVEDPVAAPAMPITDERHKLVYARFGDRLRCAGTAELVGFDRDLDARRVDMVKRIARATFPRAGDYDRAQAWAGLRPATPSNLPYVGRTRLENLWLNTGHGTLGWTLAPGNGKLVADAIAEVREFLARV